jgi:ribosomal protein S25
MPVTIVEEEEFLAAFEHFDDPVVTTSEMADFVGLQVDSARVRLKNFEEEGKVVSKDVGARGVVWWRSDLLYRYHDDLSTSP